MFPYIAIFLMVPILYSPEHFVSGISFCLPAPFPAVADGDLLLETAVSLGQQKPLAYTSDSLMGNMT